MPENLAKDTMSPTPTPHVLHDWQPTSAATGKDYAESKRVCRAIRAGRRRCWLNARKAIERLEEYAQARYVEGWAVTERGALVEHGWIVLDGKIIDPTLPENVATYFPGLEFVGRRGIAEFLAVQRYAGRDVLDGQGVTEILPKWLLVATPL
jgi:hypothetical protein